MFSKLSETITSSLIRNKTIEPDERELYCYGVKQGLTGLFNIVTMIIIGVLCGMLWQCVIFISAYIPLRHCAGGYHAKTPIQCYLFSIVLVTVALLVIKYLQWNIFIYGILLLLSIFCILVLSPVETTNKPLDILERKEYRKRTYWIITFEVGITMISILIRNDELSACLIMMFGVMSIMLILGTIDNRIARKGSSG
jgi:accessory gene regulator B